MRYVALWRLKVFIYTPDVTVLKQPIPSGRSNHMHLNVPFHRSMKAQNMPNLRKIHLTILITLIALSVLPACSASQNHTELNMAPMSGMPAEVQSAPVSVQQAYQFAVANPELMKQIPCYCGCGSIGHTSNYSCYVSNVDAKGAVSFDNHALGCSICVDITQDVTRMTKAGKSPADIRAAIDTTYSKYGSSNIPQP
jgi:hypothetical protein